jgi:hypothetical protein
MGGVLLVVAAVAACLIRQGRVRERNRPEVIKVLGGPVWSSPHYDR